MYKHYIDIKKGKTLFICVLIYLLVLNIYFYTKSFVIYPKVNVLIESYSDSNYNHGKSISEASIVKDGIRFSYSLGDTLSYPYTGLHIYFNENKEVFDISNYTRLEIDLVANHSKLMPISIYLIGEDTDTSDGKSYICLSSDLKYDSNIEHYTFNINKMDIPTYWYSFYSNKNIRIPKIQLNNASSIHIHNCAYIKRGVFESIIIKKVTLNGFKYYPLILLFSVISSVGLFVYLFLKKKQIVLYQPISIAIKNSNDEEVKKVLNFILSNYMKEELLLSFVQKELGISETKISSIIKENTGLHFKAYLNEIRLNEASRLLKNSTLSISEIAQAVGYINISHFNRMFKEKFKVSPTLFKTKD
jgi:AraC-like DNA-binding protein